ncbi:MAG: N-glycosylase/DNA lyase [Thermoproteota archaeon]|nr:N-glycosylase/DNA lyase [Candidatus Brockarchaeota archaeon]
MTGRSDFCYEAPIPVDSRIRSFTRRIGVQAEDDEAVRGFWMRVLERIKENISISMIHLDSLLWQIGTLSKSELVDYFSQLGLKDVGEELAGMLRE